MDDVDSRVHEALARVVDHEPIDPETRLPGVHDRARALERRGRFLRMGSALAVVVVFVAALAVGITQFRGGGRGTVQPAGTGGPQAAPDTEVAGRWGGELVWQSTGAPDQVHVTSGAGSSSVAVQGRLSDQAIVSPLGARHGILTFLGDGPVVLYPDGTLTRLSSQDGSGGTFAWSPDGASIAYESCQAELDCTLRIGSAADGSFDELGSSSGRGVSWSPDGTRLAYIDPDGALAAVTVATGQSTVLLSLQAAIAAVPPPMLPIPASVHLILPRWSPGGSYVAVALGAGNEGYVPLVASLDGTVVGVGALVTRAPVDMTWRPGSDQLYHSGSSPATAPQLIGMYGPDWIPSGMFLLQRAPVAGLFSSPSGDTMLLQTVDDQALATASPSGPMSFTWTVIEPFNGTVLATYRTQQKLLGWGP